MTGGGATKVTDATVVGVTAIVVVSGGCEVVVDAVLGMEMVGRLSGDGADQRGWCWARVRVFDGPVIDAARSVTG